MSLEPEIGKTEVFRLDSLLLYISHLKCSLYNRHLVRAVTQLGPFNIWTKWKQVFEQLAELLMSVCVCIYWVVLVYCWVISWLSLTEIGPFCIGTASLNLTFCFLLCISWCKSWMSVGTGWHSHGYIVTAWLGNKGDSVSRDTSSKTKKKLINNVTCFDHWVDSSKNCMC